MATADWVQTNGFGLVLWMTRRGRLQHNSFLDVDLQRPPSFAWFFPTSSIPQSAAARGSCTLSSSMQHRPLRRERRLSGSVVPPPIGALPRWKKSLDLALFLIGNRPEALAQRDRGVRILETFFRRMVPRSLDRLTHHNVDALRTPVAQVWVCVDERFLVPLHYLLEHLGLPSNYS